MRLAVIGDELAQDCRTVARTAAELRFDAVEIRSMDGTPPHLLSDAQLGAARAVLDEHGLANAGFAPPALKTALPVTDADLQAAADLLADGCRQAALLGAPHVRIFSFYRDGDPDPVRAARLTAQVLDGLDLPVPLVVENGTRTNTPTLRHLATFLDELGRDDLGILWDPGNSVFSGWDPEPFPADYEAGRERIRHVHVKDPDGTRGYVRLGDGDLDWPAILRRLAEDGYGGFVSLETHWRIGRALTATERDEPWGEAFSRGGHPAGVECMRRLRDWVDELAPAGAEP
ncbi:Xylose isomerase-like TIM barrel [Nonomuraea coxensis DSM 45129]|uniref:Xylose isomerase-like TIM barrel n=1 Tax=Nonomuraea coxensis DSM 45129 TaxID=1122611 RepID=A0ABX8U926_9ACTN|nr:sugar phosphate isomerase/epimerase family protein [Nonomuraea coxensis]QYC44238.1 Xylose isomerase-like TIM barrel [Nonomuraea coxensis DSM 45129]